MFLSFSSSRCTFNLQCRGCFCISAASIDNDQDFLLQSSDTIAISYDACVDAEFLKAVFASEDHESVASLARVPPKLSLSECLEAFSESETLDSSNPWYCPMCQMRQCATKTLTVWRFPDHLIVYLKR